MAVFISRDIVVPKKVNIEITGEGSSAWAYVSINGITYTSAATVAVEAGTTIVCTVQNNYPVTDCIITHNGTAMTTNPSSNQSASYEFTASKNTTIALSVRSGGPDNGYTWGHIDITEG